MRIAPSLIKTACVLAVGLLGATGSWAQSTWNLSTDACDPTGGTPGSAGCTQGGVTATVTAWANTGSGGNFVRANITDQGGSGVGATSVAGVAFSGPSGTIAAGTWETTSNGHHAFDNVGEGDGASPYLGGSTEAALINFTSAVSLTALTIGWYQTDADVSLYRWNGGAGGPTMTGMSTGTLVSSGWQLVSHIDADPDDIPNAISGADASSWWLVSTYFGNKSGCDSYGNNCKFDKGNDYFKLLSFAGTAAPPENQTPEPGSAALAALALLGAWGSRRRLAAKR